MANDYGELLYIVSCPIKKSDFPMVMVLGMVKLSSGYEGAKELGVFIFPANIPERVGHKPMKCSCVWDGKSPAAKQQSRRV